MKSYSLSAHLQEIYKNFPEGGHKPIIGITGNFETDKLSLGDRYYRQVVAAGGVPMVIPPLADCDVLSTTLDAIDGLLLSGGGDLNPLWEGREPDKGLGGINAERDLPELLLTRLAFNRQLPILGICRGIQTLTLALGGHVQQDINGSASVIKHSQDARRDEMTHTVTLEDNTVLRKLYGRSRICVNSFHHQAVSDPGRCLHVAATAPDGTIEAVESCEHKAIVGVQWHPEWLADDGLPLFRWLCHEAQLHHEARHIHNHTLILDSHCDTPMFFPQGVDFASRDDRILVDLHKMADGRQDVVTMAAYLPQPKPDQDFDDIAPFKTGGSTSYADLILDKIEDIAAQNADHVAIARTPADLWANKRLGRKSIMLAIENGLAVGDDLSNVEHFARRGIVYMTLCHNGDNLICDSARRSLQTHGGVSAFGEQVIQEMNRLGVMVDLSHGGERSFYDALDISRTPIVCSHSNCRALCDVSRNLTDDQMRALASRGGVMQVTLYLGFLSSSDEASIHDAVAHLEHAIDVMGIDHVGIGTDFDGDGGVPGLADSSELINFTKQLLSRRYSEQDIQRIWGGNWLRVLQQVQSAGELKR